MYSCSASGREDWGEGCHARQVCYAIKNHRRLRKCLTLRKAMPAAVRANIDCKTALNPLRRRTDLRETSID